MTLGDFRYPAKKITLPDFANALAPVYPPASYAKVAYWAKTGHLSTYRDPIKKQGHHYLNTTDLREFLEVMLGLTHQQTEIVFKNLKIVFPNKKEKA